MPNDTDRLALPYILADQAQKHVSHNEALVRLDAIVQLSVLRVDLSAPPAEPADGARYIVASGASGAWIGLADTIAVWQDGAWMHLAPQIGWRCWSEADSVLLVYGDAGWVPAGISAADLGSGAVQTFGVNTTADDFNRLAVKTSAVLISHDDVSGSGNGSVLGTFNKEAESNESGFAFQTGWSTRALMGLYGDDDFRIKVSPDGTTFADALVIDKDTGWIGIGTDSPSASLSVSGAGGFTGLSIEDASGGSANATWLLTSYHNPATSSDALRVVNLGTGFGTGGVIAEFRKTASASPRIGFGGFADDASLLSIANNLNLSAADGVKSYNSAVSPGAYSTFLATVTATAGQRMYSGRGNGTETFYVMGDGSAYLAGKLGVGTVPGAEAIRANGTIAHASDNTYSFGTAALRASVVYAATGTINTSDAAEKSLRSAPTAAELRAWARVRPVVFQWNDAIDAKGADNARMHLGYIAQDVADAFRAEGLDPERYALFCTDAVVERRPVSRTRAVTRPVTRPTTRRREEIEIREGVPVLVVHEDKVEEPVVREMPVLDEAGEAVLDAAGCAVTYPVPETETVEIIETVDVEAATGEKRYGLRYDQCLVLEAAYLRWRIEALEAAGHGAPA